MSKCECGNKAVGSQTNDVFGFITGAESDCRDLNDHLIGLTQAAMEEDEGGMLEFAARVVKSVKNYCNNVQAGFERLSNDG